MGITSITPNHGYLLVSCVGESGMQDQPIVLRKVYLQYQG